MSYHGRYVLDFQVPALVASDLKYFDGNSCRGRVVVLCFLPYPGVVPIEELDRRHAEFAASSVHLLIVASGARSLEDLWIGSPVRPQGCVLGDPCGRLHRAFRVPRTSASMRCLTFVTDPRGILRLRLTHDFRDPDLQTLRHIVSVYTGVERGEPLRAEGSCCVTH